MSHPPVPLAPLVDQPVGRLPYLNVLPFHHGWRGPEPRWIEAPPRHLGELAARGALRAAPLASRDALALGDDFRSLGRLGIACTGAVESVLLCSHRPPEELDGATVALTGESRTSRGLLRVLLAGYWRVRPHLVEARSLATQGAQGMEPPAARLLIGDAALREVAQRGSAWPHLIDLGAAWREWTGLPFVYARWVVARDAPEGLAPALESALESALEISLGSLTPQNRYLNNLQYRLGAAEEAGLERFHEELKRHDLLGHHRREGRRRTAA